NCLLCLNIMGQYFKIFHNGFLRDAQSGLLFRTAQRQYHLWILLLTSVVLRCHLYIKMLLKTELLER
ncbi:MAG: hypothetical protein SOY51_00190, partial [Streptococcus dysgalactiae]|nr:hypothetical protein [Streptococcus dysgalactiae]